MVSGPPPVGAPARTALVHELVAARAALTPRATAVVAAGRELDYAELDARANRLAHALRGLGVGPDTVVGVCLRRSADLVCVLLAVWRAGGAYLPLDPDQPRSRLAAAVRDTGVGLVVAEDAVLQVLARSGARPVALSAVLARSERLPETAPESTAGPDHAAYVIHTSGATGAPKGVVVTHGGIANRIGWTVRRPGLCALDRVLQRTALTFDAHCWEVFGPLVSGAAVVMAPAGAERDPAVLLRAVAEHRITVLQVVPSVLRLLVAEPGWEHCGSLRLLFSAGEPLHAELAQQAMRLVPGPVEIWNTYGPAACSIDVTAHRFDPAQRSGPVPIGRPLDNLRALVLDRDGRPVAPGVPGELYAGGVGVARGYLGRPALTAERFVPDPFAGDGSRLYRTGDRVRQREDGVLEYLGRIGEHSWADGARIEPAQVEGALIAHPGVGGVIVTAFTAEDGTERLAAYVQTRGGEVLRELGAYLDERLARTPVSAVLIEVEEFPLTASGKVDRTALPLPGGPGAAEGPARVAPRTPEERLVAEVWQQLLKVRDVSVHDDYFRLGGSSLQLARLVDRLRAASGRDIRLPGLFSATTVEAQARLLCAPVPA